MKLGEVKTDVEIMWGALLVIPALDTRSVPRETGEGGPGHI